MVSMLVYYNTVVSKFTGLTEMIVLSKVTVNDCDDFTFAAMKISTEGFRVPGKNHYVPPSSIIKIEEV